MLHLGQDGHPYLGTGGADRREILPLSLQLSRLERAAWWLGPADALLHERTQRG
jgi:hypothetical protein